MDAIEILKTQHAEMAALFAKLDDETDDADWRELVGRFVDRLTMHAALEEEIFYPAVAGLPEGAPRIAHARDEHANMTHLLEPLRDLRVDRWRCAEALRELRRTVEHHVAEEEHEVMPCAERLGPAALCNLAERIEARMHVGDTGMRLAAGARR